MSSRCPHCERGDLESRTIEETIRYGGSRLAVPGVEISVCPVCSEELVLPEQAKANERRFSDAKRAHDGLLTSVEIAAWRKRHGLTQHQAATLVGGGINAFSKYERGEVMQSQAIDTLMRSVDEVHGMLAYLCGNAGIALRIAPTQQRRPSNIVALATRRVTRTLDAANDVVGQWCFDAQLELVANG